MKAFAPPRRPRAADRRHHGRREDRQRRQQRAVLAGASKSVAPASEDERERHQDQRRAQQQHDPQGSQHEPEPGVEVVPLVEAEGVTPEPPSGRALQEHDRQRGDGDDGGAHQHAAERARDEQREHGDANERGRRLLREQRRASSTPAITAAGADERARQAAHRPAVTRPSHTLSMRTRSYQAPVGAKAAAEMASPPRAIARGVRTSRRNGVGADEGEEIADDGDRPPAGVAEAEGDGDRRHEGRLERRIGEGYEL